VWEPEQCTDSSREKGRKDIKADSGVDGHRTECEYYNKLFLIEQTLKGRAPEEIKRIRNEKESPILEEFFTWIGTSVH